MLAGCRSDLSFIARDDSDWDRLMLHPNLETTHTLRTQTRNDHKDVSSVRDRTTVWCVGSHLRAPAPAETSYLPTSYPAEPSGAPQTSSTQILRAHPISVYYPAINRIPWPPHRHAHRTCGDTGHDGSGLTSQVSRVAMVSIKNLHFPWNRFLSLKCCTVSLSA